MVGMRTAGLICGLALLTTGAAWAQAGAPATLRGTVVDAATGEGLPGAHVFIATSMIGTATDEAGRFVLANVPAGAHRLYVSMIGFEPAARDTLLRAGQSYSFEFFLPPTVVSLGDVTVTATRAKRWRKRLHKFERYFLGETDNAAETKILNPEVLSFDGGWARLAATASAPLVIENQALGYRLQYFLKEFERSGNTIRYDGEPFFEELTPTDADEAARWEANRRRAYYGSFRHYLLALLAGESKDVGFRTYLRRSLERGTGATDRFWADVSKLFRDGPTPTEKLLRFSGYLEIVYDEEREDAGYLRWIGRSAWQAPGNQRSWMRLTDGPTLVDHTGEVLDPYGVTVYGYFAYERIAELLPKEYRPDAARP